MIMIFFFFNLSISVSQVFGQANWVNVVAELIRHETGRSLESKMQRKGSISQKWVNIHVCNCLLKYHFFLPAYNRSRIEQTELSISIICALPLFLKRSVDDFVVTQSIDLGVIRHLSGLENLYSGYHMAPIGWSGEMCAAAWKSLSWRRRTRTHSGCHHSDDITWL